MQTPQSWRTLERYALCGATQREWIRSSGIQWAELCRWLRPCRARARWVGDPEFAGHRLSVVQIGSEILATSEQSPPHRAAISLTPADITLYALNVATLAEYYGERLGIAWDAPRPHPHGMWKIGVWSRPTETARPVFFFLPESALGGCQQLHRAISTIRDCVLLCCTAEHLRGDTLELARERGVEALVLTDIGPEPLPLDNLRSSAPATLTSTSRKTRQLLDVPHGCTWQEVEFVVHRSRFLTIRVRGKGKRFAIGNLGLRGRNRNSPSTWLADLAILATKQRFEPKGVTGRSREKRLERFIKTMKKWLVIRGEPFVKSGGEILPVFRVTTEGDTGRKSVNASRTDDLPADDLRLDPSDMDRFSIVGGSRDE